MLERTALEAFGVSKRYADRDVLSRVDLVARPGQLHGLLGPNGAGKTTLLRVLLGLVPRDAGAVRLLGRSLASSVGPVPDGVAGFVETPSFYPYLSGRRNLELLARLDGGSPAGRTDSVGDALDQVGLASQADVGVAAYSAGMRQRLGVAAALLRSPRLLLLDEPTSLLDPAGARDVRTLVRRLAEEGAAVVLSSHDMAEVEELCAVLTIVHHGRVVFSGTIDQLRKLAPATVHTMRTSNDRAALDLALRRPDVKVAPAYNGDGLEVSADVEALDGYIIALGIAGVAVRVLERRARSLESVFLQLTGPGVAGEEPASARNEAPDGDRPPVGAS